MKKVALREKLKREREELEKTKTPAETLKDIKEEEKE